jgi:hypothetical protein
MRCSGKRWAVLAAHHPPPTHVLCNLPVNSSREGYLMSAIPPNPEMLQRSIRIFKTYRRNQTLTELFQPQAITGAL